MVLNSFSHVFESDAVVKPLCPLANLFGGCFCLGSRPLCVSGLLFLLTKRKSGCRICGSSGWFVGCLVCYDLHLFLDLFWSLYKIALYCLCSCKDRATVRHRPHSREKNNTGCTNRHQLLGTVRDDLPGDSMAQLV